MLRCCCCFLISCSWNEAKRFRPVWTILKDKKSLKPISWGSIFHPQCVSDCHLQSFRLLLYMSFRKETLKKDIKLYISCLSFIAPLNKSPHSLSLWCRKEKKWARLPWICCFSCLPVSESSDLDLTLITRRQNVNSHLAGSFIFDKISAHFSIHFLKECLLAMKLNVIFIILMVLQVSNLLRMEKIRAATISWLMNYWMERK